MPSMAVAVVVGTSDVGTTRVAIMVRVFMVPRSVDNSSYSNNWCVCGGAGDEGTRGGTSGVRVCVKGCMGQGGEQGEDKNI